jgi:hypothetical protein
VDIPPGQSQTFVLSVTASGPVGPEDLTFLVEGDNSGPAPIGAVNTLLFSASATPVPDIVALSATLGNDGIVHVPAPGQSGAFAVSIANVGAAGAITASADTGGIGVPVDVAICQTDPGTGQCLAAPAASVPLQISAGQFATFGVFVHARASVALDPAINRVFVRFRDGGFVVRGATSVAVTAP